jgi:phospholipid-transporting ATPase
MSSPAPAAKAAPYAMAMNNPAKNKLSKFPDNFIKTAKFTILTFLPLDLLHQFRKVSNFYFLVNMIVALLPNVSPIHPATAVLPLIFVIGVALIKDGYEEFLRHKADNRANSAVTHVVRMKDGKAVLEDIESRDVQVGDIIRILNGEEIRADVLLLSSSGIECCAFIDTCNLDGETNLKNRKGANETWELNTIEACAAAEMTIEMGKPSPALLSWGGVVTLNGEEFSVGLDQFLYRSCLLKNTEWALGVVMYAGIDTKMFRNLEEKPPKMSSLDEKLNKLIVGVLVAQILLLGTMAGYAVGWTEERASGSWYMDYYLKQQVGFELFGYRFLSYFILMSYMIPISLFVTIELCKVAQAKLMEWDHEMFEWMYGKWVHCTPNTSDLNEQLAQVKFIFSDKTGTLTENVMVYKKGDLLGLPVVSEDWDTSIAYFNNDTQRDRALTYFKSLALCHTIQPFDDPKNEGQLMYDGASPDEVALVKAACEHNIVLTKRSTKSMTIEVDGKEEKYDIMATLEFTPDRKMMSIVVRDEAGKIQIITKGADSFVIPRLHATANIETLPPLSQSLGEMAQLGLRTLIVCGRELTQQQFDEWYVKFVEAGKALENRSEIVDVVCLELELELVLQGSTAIEDKLQDKVPETLQFFLDAGVVIWMLTGDKRETAVTIGATSSLCNPLEDYIDHIDLGNTEADSDAAPGVVQQQLQVIENHLNIGDKKCTFVVDGVALVLAMEHHPALFLSISQRVSSAICCRLTPLQKANVVKMFQTATGTTALAIGDGANDVSMIKEGRVGVGIMGLEGAQAALAADYAIPRFKHLKRLCCVHGRYSVARNSLCVMFSFYKNIMVALIQFYYVFYTGSSGLTYVDGWLLSFFNFAFTSIPPLLLGIFDKDIAEPALMADAKLYPDLAKGMYFDVPTMVRWFGESIIHSLLLFFLALPMAYRADIEGNRIMDFTMHGVIVMSALVFMVLVKLCLHIRCWQSVQAAGMIYSFIQYPVFLVLYAAIQEVPGGVTGFYFAAYTVMGDAKFWLYIGLFVFGLLFPVDMAVIFVQKQMFPSIHDRAQARYELLDE